MRRMSGRSPPFVSIGLAFVAVILAYNCWTLSSQNGDLSKEIEDLQTEIKLNGVQQDQFKKKMQMLQENVNKMDARASRLQHKAEEDEGNLNDAQNNIKRKEFEITSLKNEVAKFQETKNDLQQQIQSKDEKILTLQNELQNIQALKDGADKFNAEKDKKINELMRRVNQDKSLAATYESQVKSLKEQISKLTMELSQLQKEKAKPDIIAGPMNIPNAEDKEPYLDNGLLPYVSLSAVHDNVKSLSGFIPHPGMPILPRQPSNAQRSKPRFSVANIVSRREFSPDRKDPNVGPQEPIKPKLSGILDKNVSKQPVVLDVNPGNIGIEKPISRPELQQKKPLTNPEEKASGEKRESNFIPVLKKPSEFKETVDGGAANPVIHEPDILQQDGADFQQNEISNWQERAHVLPAPLQNPDENPDTAIDDEEKIVEDPSDDQDEEGKEIKKDFENKAEENYNNGDYDLEGLRMEKAHKPFRNLEPHGIGANIVIPKEDIDAGGEDGREDVNVDEDKDQRAHDKVFDTNIESNLRKLGQV